MSSDARAVLEQIATAHLRRCSAGYLQQMAVEFLASPQLTGVDRIAAERWRQITQKGWTPEHDRTEHEDGSLTDAAAALVLEFDGAAEVEDVIDRAPLWVAGLVRHEAEKYTGQDRIRLLEIAGALIAAELDRLDGAS